MQARSLVAIFAVLLSLAPASAQDAGFAKPSPVIREIVAGMPKGDKQEISVFTAATFRPGDRTVFHTHRFPVTVYVLEGAFTLELDGRPQVVAKAGESIVEPPNVKMTGYNRSTSDFTKVVIFYVADPGTPFLDLQH